MAFLNQAANKVKVFLGMIKFEHTLFALPFAYTGLWLGERGWPRFHVFAGVTIAMVGMRTAAMSFNRLADHSLDSVNPRTSQWALPRGLLSRSAVWVVMMVSLLLYFLSSAMLNRLCFFLSPIPMIMIMIYPYLKRFTWFCHFFLGMILGVAPAAGWVASRGNLSPECWFLFGSVLFWVAGFDMIYALQDVSFDRSHGLKSFPAEFDLRPTLWLTRVLHLMTLTFLALLGWTAQLGLFYWAGLVLIILFLIREHWLVAREGLTKIQEAFFQMNVLVSGVLFLATCLDLAKPLAL